MSEDGKGALRGVVVAVDPATESKTVVHRLMNADGTYREERRPRMTWIREDDCARHMFGRIVWAIMEADGYDADADYEGIARAALTAMMEPTDQIEDGLAEGIIQAGELVPAGLGDGWRLAIQAILNEGAEK